LAKLPDAESKEKLKQIQRAWLAFRDAEAAFAADEARGGSMEPTLRYATMRQSFTSRSFRRRKKSGVGSNFFAMSQRRESTRSQMKNGSFDSPTFKILNSSCSIFLAFATGSLANESGVERLL